MPGGDTLAPPVRHCVCKSFQKLWNIHTALPLSGRQRHVHRLPDAGYRRPAAGFSPASAASTSAWHASCNGPT